jgi:nucleotide-binding universal stress UspA family protein
MFEHVLVPLDGSSLAECVLPHAVALAQAFGSQVTLLEVIEPTTSGQEVQAVDPLRWEIRRSEAEAYLTAVGERLEAVGIETQEVLLEGDGAERILDLAHERDVDLTIMSSHGRGGLSKWNINSTVQKVILQAYMPVLIVRAYQPVPQELAGLRYRLVMVPLDGSRRAESVLPLADGLCQYHDAQVLLPTVVNRPSLMTRKPPTEQVQQRVDQITDYNRERATEYLAELEERMELPVKTRVVVNEHTAAALHRLVEEEHVDLVVLSAHGRSAEPLWPYGGVALNFISFGSSPLLIVQDIPEERIRPTEAARAAREEAGH